MKPGEEAVTESRAAGELDARAEALRTLNEDGVPYLVAGAYAFFEYTGIFRDTKDLDVFLRRRDLPRAMAALDRAGWRTELVDPVWLAKGWKGEWFVDVIFSSGNGVAVVDDGWFEHAGEADVMGVPTLIAPPEEIIWSKAFVCERERYDGHDVSNLIRARGLALDWDRLLARFGEHWEVLLSHLVMYRFAFPSERTNVPDWVMRELLRRTWEGVVEGDAEERVCQGSLVSKEQYRHVLRHLGYRDARARWAVPGRGCDERPAAREAPAEEVEDATAVSPGGAG